MFCACPWYVGGNSLKAQVFDYLWHGLSLWHLFTFLFFFYLREEQSNNKKTVAILKFITMQKISKDMLSKGVSLSCWWMKRILCNHLQNLLYRLIAVLQEVTDL